MSRQYIVSSKAVKASRQGKSFKSYCASTKIGKTDYAIASEALKYLSVMESVIKRASIKVEDLEVDPDMFMVMVYEMLFGKGKIQGGGTVKRKVMEYLDVLKAALEEELAVKQVSKAAELLPINVQIACKMPRYVRVNCLKVSSFQKCFEDIQKVWPMAVVDCHIPSLVVLPSNTKALGQHPLVKSSAVILQDKASCMPSQILHDEVTERQNAESVRRKLSNSVTSTSPVTSTWIDACAAPGNKTSHLASMIKSFSDSQQISQFSNRIIAFDKSAERSQLLRSRMEAAGATENDLVSVMNADFLAIDVTQPEYADVRYILLDPSCSGSGVVRAIERVLERKGSGTLGGGLDGIQAKNMIVGGKDKGKGKQQVVKLSKKRAAKQLQQQKQAAAAAVAKAAARTDGLRTFQIQALLKAMSFPNIEVISYSTCSVDIPENEGVVAHVLSSSSCDGGTMRDLWAVKAPSGSMSSWERRGVPLPPLSEEQCVEVMERDGLLPSLTQEEQNGVIRCLPEDGMNGFFVALFVKRSADTFGGNK